jgi:hypothetical protein
VHSAALAFFLEQSCWHRTFREKTRNKVVCYGYISQMEIHGMVMIVDSMLYTLNR